MSTQMSASLGVFEFGQRLRAAFCRETSELPEQWTPKNPSKGQCHVSALLLQEEFGGDIHEGCTSTRIFHYWSVIDGITIDITRDQFPWWRPIMPVKIADPPNATTRAKADLLRRLAFPEAEAA